MPFGWTASLSLNQASQAAPQYHYGDRREIIAWHRKCVDVLNTVKSGLGTKLHGFHIIQQAPQPYTLIPTRSADQTLSGMSTLTSGMTSVSDSKSTPVYNTFCSLQWRDWRHISVMASQITDNSTVFSISSSGQRHKRINQSSAFLAFVVESTQNDRHVVHDIT